MALSEIRGRVLSAVKLRFAPRTDGWCPLRESVGLCVRWTSEIQSTPDRIRLPFQSSVGEARSPYPFDTYEQHVFVTLVGPEHSFSVIVRTCRCPWVRAQDRTVSLRRALEILEDPESAL
jgi:hypothetical protein